MEETRGGQAPDSREQMRDEIRKSVTRYLESRMFSQPEGSPAFDMFAGIVIEVNRRIDQAAAKRT